MASASGPATSPDVVNNHDDNIPHTESRSSHINSDGAEGSSATCLRRGPEIHDQESVGGSDSPSHTTERRRSTDRTEEQASSSRLEFQRAELPYDLYGDGDGTGQNSPMEPPADSTTSNQTPPRDIGTGDWLSSSVDAESPNRMDASSHRSETPEPIEQGADTQPEWSFAQTQSSAISPSSRSNADVERNDELLDRESAGLQRPTASAVVHSPRTVSEGNLPPDQGAPAPLQNVPRQRHARPHQSGSRSPSDFALPRWQPDAEVTYCPICHTQFSFFVRKHHCRKCGRVVCNSCSPHRIIIPHQYIVRPPGSEVPMPQSLLMDSLGIGYLDVNGMSGGERVRLCNPCVPDPNTTPLQRSPASPTTPSSLSPRSSHQRSRSSIGNAYGAAVATNRYGVVFASGQSHDPFQAYAHRTRGITMGPTAHAPSPSRSRSGGHAYYSPMGRYSASGSSSTSVPSYPSRYGSMRNAAPSSSQRRVLPPAPQIAEEDECPICHRELPSQNLENFESLRESHINTCIQAHSTYGSPRPGGDGDDAQPAAAPRRTGMYTYTATEKDCIDDAECTICLEEFTVGVPMARLECLCRFHRSCISAWFVKNPGRCPVHGSGEGLYR